MRTTSPRSVTCKDISCRSSDQRPTRRMRGPSSSMAPFSIGPLEIGQTQRARMTRGMKFQERAAPPARQPLCIVPLNGPFLAFGFPFGRLAMVARFEFARALADLLLDLF